MNDDEPKRAESRTGATITGWLHLPAILMLLLAAALKSHQLATSPYLENLLFQSRPLSMLLIVYEVCLAFWLLSTWRPQIARLVAIATFALFSAMTLPRHLAGEDSCGCFGVIEIKPIYTILLDLAIIACLVMWNTAANEAKWLKRVSAAAAIVLSIGLVIPVFGFSSQTLDDVGTILDQDQIIVVEPEKWQSKGFPLARYIDDGEYLLAGRWKVVLYHEDCPKCQELMRISATYDGDPPIVFVEAPPYKSPHRSDTEYVRWLRLQDDYNWFVEAPDLIELDDGTVTSVDDDPGPETVR